MMLESLAVVQAQLGDSLSDYCTLQTDGTTKFGEHYATYDMMVQHIAWECVMFFQGPLVIHLKHLKRS